MCRGYLSVFTTGKVSSAGGNFSEADFDARRAFMAPVKSIVCVLFILLSVCMFMLCVLCAVQIYSHNLEWRPL